MTSNSVDFVNVACDVKLILDDEQKVLDSNLKMISTMKNFSLQLKIVVE